MRRIETLTAAALGLAAVFFVVPASATEPQVRTIERFYDISGTSGKALKREMTAKGPKGFWAYTTWRVSWSAQCQVQLTVTYTLPRLREPNRVPLPLRRRFADMLKKLTAHERQHGQHGINAAREVAEAQCRNANSIVAKWGRQDRIYDRQTRHGLHEGVQIDDR